MTFRHLFFYLLSFLPIMAMADQSNVQINGIYYNLYSETYEAEVTSNPDKYSGSITIPPSFIYGGKTYKVTSIGQEAFKKSHITSIDLPSSLILLGNWAFGNCDQLTDVTIPEGVITIGNCVFANCRQLANVNIPSSVTSVGQNPFSGSKWELDQREHGPVYLDNWLIYAYGWPLGNFVVKEGTKGIAGDAFFDREDLTGVTIPSSIISICDGAFYHCVNLTSVNIKGGTPSINYCAFSFCI